MNFNMTEYNPPMLRSSFYNPSNLKFIFARPRFSAISAKSQRFLGHKIILGGGGSVSLKIPQRKHKKSKFPIVEYVEENTVKIKSRTSMEKFRKWDTEKFKLAKIHSENIRKKLEILSKLISPKTVNKNGVPLIIKSQILPYTEKNQQNKFSMSATNWNLPKEKTSLLKRNNYNSFNTHVGTTDFKKYLSHSKNSESLSDIGKNSECSTGRFCPFSKFTQANLPSPFKISKWNILKLPNKNTQKTLTDWHSSSKNLKVLINIPNTQYNT